MKILIVDDDTYLLDVLSARLSERGFAVDVAGTGTEGIGQARVNTYDLIILDLNLPDMSGEAVCKSLNSYEKVPPILMLTAVPDTESKVRLLDAGADDYVNKPFSTEELLARIRALLRRSGKEPDKVLTAGDIVLDIRQRLATLRGKELRLTRIELALLEYLMRYQGHVVSKGALIEHVWESTANTFAKGLEVHMGNLRKKLGNPTYIETIHSIGYRFK